MLLPLTGTPDVDCSSDTYAYQDEDGDVGCELQWCHACFRRSSQILSSPALDCNRDCSIASTTNHENRQTDQGCQSPGSRTAILVAASCATTSGNGLLTKRPTKLTTEHPSDNNERYPYSSHATMARALVLSTLGYCLVSYMLTMLIGLTGLINI